jgi:hypothetical protein
MARGVAAVPLVMMLAIPAGAEAASGRVTVPVPANGDVAFTQYRVTTSSPGKAKILNARRLGDLRIDVAGRRISRRAYEVTVFALNPKGGPSAAQEQRPVIRLNSFLGDLRIRTKGSADNLLSRSPTAREAGAVDRLCQRSRTRRRRYFATSRRFSRRDNPMRNFRFQGVACQDRPPAETIAGRATLAALGADPPTCMGTAQRYLDLTNEIDARMICSGPTRAIGLRAATGNNGLNCVGPPDSVCACGPSCAPFPPESGCFIDNDGFAMNTPLDFRVSYEGPIQPQEITAVSVPQGSPAVDHQFAYLRYILEAP